MGRKFVSNLAGNLVVGENEKTPVGVPDIDKALVLLVTTSILSIEKSAYSTLRQLLLPLNMDGPSGSIHKKRN